MITVASFLWFDDARQRSYQFSADDIRIWKNMVSRNLTVPHRIVCVTHRPDLVEDFIETIPLDTAKHVPGTCCVKLQAHKPGGVAKEGERVLLMDIDCVVTGNLDPIIQRGWSDYHQRNEPAVWWTNPNFSVGGRRGFIQGSLQLFTVGATECLWRDFDPRTTPGWYNRRFGGAEQAWISERLNTAYPDAGWKWDVPTFTDADGVYGAGRLVNGRMGNGVQSELPENARIVFFPGNRAPSQQEVRQVHPWISAHYF